MMADVSFSVPLQVSFANGLTRTFESLHDTSDFLEREWPLRHGDRYKRACEKCRAALLRQASVTVAREAFIAACVEAGLAVQVLPAAWRRSASPSPPRIGT
ncbi:hypothetical protein QO002_005552 [Pararhizobium capsulatum DSM 1112]|uniref:DUF982 domain-containing protein n=1 Tax=Pararhizobium capsulatum DSM 1112 TaxID=1121113 RepID=A0ABU0C0B8_9HYPH|nr:DUF982 domain-containing protein [Pararhizobium capsulatum]MDQ0323346.1 hypothetical protein [Pararhizobium capsulatum DSM 1112]